MNKFKSVLHLLIITMFLFGLNACGYKAPPFYGTSNDTSASKTLIENNKSEKCVEKK